MIDEDNWAPLIFSFNPIYLLSVVHFIVENLPSNLEKCSIINFYCNRWSTFNGRIVKLFKDAQVHVFCFHQCSLHKLLLIHGNFKTIYMHLYFYFGNIQTEIKISVYYSLMYSSTRLLYVFIVVKYPFLITVIWSTCQWLFVDRTSFDGRYDMRDDDRNIQFELDHLATFSSRSGFKSKHTSLYKMHFIAKRLALFYLYLHQFCYLEFTFKIH